MKRLLFIGFTLLLAQNLLAQTKVVFSQQGGFYEDSFPLELWCPDGLHVRYTVNGATPTADAQPYSENMPLLSEQLYSTKMTVASVLW